MNVHLFSNQLMAMHQRLAQLYTLANDESPVIQPDLLPTAFKELGSASEELHVAAEELWEQADELANTRLIIEAERQRYQELFEFSPDAYLVTDAEGVIQEANQAASTLFNISSSFLMGKPLSIFIDKQDVKEFRSQLNQLREENRCHEWIVHLCPRKSRPIEVAMKVGTIRDLNNELLGLRICIRDITERQQMLKVLQTSEYELYKDRPMHFYTKGDMIPLQRQTIWIVVQGLVKLSTFSECGEEQVVGLAGAKRAFGSSLTALETYQATVLSKQLTLVCVSLPEIAACAELAQAILPLINQRLQQAEALLVVSGKRRVSDRLYHLLLLLKHEIGQPASTGTRLSVRLTHQDLAQACCTTRVTVTRVLGQLQAQGQIIIDSKSHIILTHGSFQDAYQLRGEAI